MPELNQATEVCKSPSILQLSYGMEQANTYFLISNWHAIIMDACSKSVAEELDARELVPDYVILTHEHADHLWGLNHLREKFPEIKVIAHEQCSKPIMNPRANKAVHYWIYAVIRFGEGYRDSEAENRKYYCKPADIEFSDRYEFQWQGYWIQAFHTPCHSPGSCLIFLSEDMVFSGDTMLNEDTFLKFDGGDAERFLMAACPVIRNIEKDVKNIQGMGRLFEKRLGYGKPVKFIHGPVDLGRSRKVRWGLDGRDVKR